MLATSLPVAQWLESPTTVRAENLNVSLRDILNVTFCCLIHYQVTDLLLSVRLRESGASGENRPVVTERGGGNKWLFPCLLWYHISS